MHFKHWSLVKGFGRFAKTQGLLVKLPDVKQMSKELGSWRAIDIHYIPKVDFSNSAH